MKITCRKITILKLKAILYYLMADEHRKVRYYGN